MTTPFPPLTAAERLFRFGPAPAPAPATAPAFGGYLAVPQGSGNATIFAWWTDGRAALRFYPGGAWHPHPAPDYAALFHPAAPASFGATAAAPWDRGPEPTQDRPADAPEPGRDD